eukprot:SAG22_NODE_669_length_7994_cov_2.526536_7_plen_294_part_00
MDGRVIFSRASPVAEGFCGIDRICQVGAFPCVERRHPGEGQPAEEAGLVHRGPATANLRWCGGAGGAGGGGGPGGHPWCVRGSAVNGARWPPASGWNLLDTRTPPSMGLGGARLHWQGPPGCPWRAGSSAPHFTAVLRIPGVMHFQVFIIHFLKHDILVYGCTCYSCMRGWDSGATGHEEATGLGAAHSRLMAAQPEPEPQPEPQPEPKPEQHMSDLAAAGVECMEWSGVHLPRDGMGQGGVKRMVCGTMDDYLNYTPTPLRLHFTFSPRLPLPSPAPGPDRTFQPTDDTATA